MITHLINLFFPKSCAACTSFLLADEIVICTSCRHKLPVTNHHLTKDNEVIKKFYGRIPLEFGSALFYFHKRGMVQEMIHRLKYKSLEDVGEMIGNWYAEEMKNIEIITSADFIIPVPLHKKRLRERGYNQVEKFGKAISEKFNIPYNDTILVRKVYAKTQTKKNLLGRNDISVSTFDVVFDASLDGKHFILVDDVITSGATLELCSRALLKIPNVKISIVCMAMSHS
ncbi:ComF family protein [Flavobacterium capsici]|uniref:ComF family protein n=1 Tax=Flavobacterium capsici TaxID=3075618 RepID=A0AA96F0Z9_9FLAO|nr:MULTISPECIES: phosphoribosyltransferase family protein [unclassified Flavobacterium]WNM19559.1 ComF family protein [Flavobacterium sp. PMR2A8]WNM20948.1 ComF family protein [Flavobacterium sp. PMTSA4]